MSPPNDIQQHLVIRRLMTATIVDTQFLKDLRQIFRTDLAGTAWAWLAEECFTYLDKYGEAPGRNIETIWASRPMSSEVRELVETVLTGISHDYQQSTQDLNPQFLLQEAADYFSKELIMTEALRAEEAASEGDIAAASKILTEFRPIVIQSMEMTDPSLDSDGIRKAFLEQPESLVKLGGAFQEAVGTQITKDSFVAFLGKEKVGKTWLLQALAFSAIKAGHRVAFFQAGDLSKSQQLIRWGIQIAGRSHKEQYCSKGVQPVLDCRWNQRASCKEQHRKASTGCIASMESKPYPTFYPFGSDEVASYEPCPSLCPRFKPDSWWQKTPKCRPLLWTEAVAKWQSWRRATGDRLRLGFWPTRTLNVVAIDRVLHRMKDQQGWVPDVVIVDYFDILAPESNISEFRHQENARWEAGRRLSQEWGCALITVTQATRESYDRRLLKLKFTSEDKRKHAHLTAYFGMNKDEHDKARGWLRINSLLVREDDFATNDQLTVLQHIQRGKPNICSFWHIRNGEE